jgi:hypothetical protein
LNESGEKMEHKDRQRIESCLAQIDAWRGSGLSLKAYSAQAGQGFARLRAWASFEADWREQIRLAQRCSFVQVLTLPDGLVRGEMTVTPPRQPLVRAPFDFGPSPSLRITVQSAGARAAHIEWPTDQQDWQRASASWLRQVLA